MERKKIYLKLKVTMLDSTAAKLTKIILDTLDMWNIEKHLIFGLMFDTTSVNSGIHQEVIVQCSCLEKAFSSFLQLAKTNVGNLEFSIQLLQDL